VTPAIPTNSVGDLRRREEFKQSTKGNFEMLDGAFDQHHILRGEKENNLTPGQGEDGFIEGGSQTGGGQTAGDRSNIFSGILGFSGAAVSPNADIFTQYQIGMINLMCLCVVGLHHNVSKIIML
jgi:hypothetical protein